MAPALYEASVVIFIRQLNLLRDILNKGAKWCQENGHSEDKLLQSRLADDMNPLTFQVQSCCDDSAKLFNRLLDRNEEQAPRTETTFAELHCRIDKALALLQSVDPADFEGKESKTILWVAGPITGTYDGWTYVQEVAVPNFLFHKTTAYALLRKEGVKLGKFDFIGVPSKGMTVMQQ
ncbi:hypothetical protein MBLNU457_4775t1 [Dothideomycetes sp. NU457]